MQELSWIGLDFTKHLGARSKQLEFTNHVRINKENVLGHLNINASQGWQVPVLLFNVFDCWIALPVFRLTFQALKLWLSHCINVENLSLHSYITRRKDSVHIVLMKYIRTMKIFCQLSYNLAWILKRAETNINRGQNFAQILRQDTLNLASKYRSFHWGHKMKSFFSHLTVKCDHL